MTVFTWPEAQTKQTNKQLLLFYPFYKYFSTFPVSQSVISFTRLTERSNNLDLVTNMQHERVIAAQTTKAQGFSGLHVWHNVHTEQAVSSQPVTVGLSISFTYLFVSLF